MTNCINMYSCHFGDENLKSCNESYYYDNLKTNIELYYESIILHSIIEIQAMSSSFIVRLLYRIKH